MIPGKQLGPHDLIAIARRRKWLILAPFVVIVTVVALWANAQPNSYRSETLILVVPQRVPESYVKSTVTARIEDRLQSITQQILSRTRLERIIQDFNLYAEKRRTGIMEDIVERMRKDIDVQIVKGDAFRVSFIADEARTAMKVTERLASLFIEENLRDREVLADSANQFLEAQLEDSRRRLIETEKKLEEYNRQHSGELPKQKEGNMLGLHNTEMQLQALLESLNRDRDSKLMLERSLADAAAMPEQSAPSLAFVATPEDPLAVAGGTADRLQSARAALQALLLQKTENHPDVVRLKRIVSELEQKADKEAAERPVSAPVGTRVPMNAAEGVRANRIKELRSQHANLETSIVTKSAEEKRLRTIMAEYQRRVEAAPTRESELSELTRDYDTLQGMYRALLGKKEDSKVAANLERRQIGEQFKILDPARLPEKPYSPDRVRINLIGAISALVIGVALTALLEYENKTMRTEEDVRAALNLAVLATIPMISRKRLTRRWYLRWKVVAVAGSIGMAAVGAVAWKLLR